MAWGVYNDGWAPQDDREREIKLAFLDGYQDAEDARQPEVDGLHRERALYVERFNEWCWDHFKGAAVSSQLLAECQSAWAARQPEVDWLKAKVEARLALNDQLQAERDQLRAQVEDLKAKLLDNEAGYESCRELLRERNQLRAQVENQVKIITQFSADLARAREALDGVTTTTITWAAHPCWCDRDGVERSTHQMKCQKARAALKSSEGT
jgi:cell division protein FtsB